MSRPARCKQTKIGSIGTRPSGTLQTRMGRLWFAVLNRAIADMASQNERHRESAKYWFSRQRDEGPGSFVWCCNFLDIDSGSIRNKVGKIKIKNTNLTRRPCQWPGGCTELSQYGRRLCIRHSGAVQRRKKRGWPESRWYDPIVDLRKKSKKGQ